MVLENIHHELRVAAYVYNPSPREDYCELKTRWATAGAFACERVDESDATRYTII